MKCALCKEYINNTKSVKVSKKFRYIICSKCSGGTLTPVLTDKELNEVYQSQEYQDNLYQPVKNKLMQWVFTKRIYQTPSEWVNERFKQGRVLDVGCGGNNFLGELQDKGWDVYGSDVSKLAVEKTNLQLGKNRAKVGMLTKQSFNQNFDMVSFWHILEHLKDPSSYINKARDLLKKNGVIVGEIPNFDSPLLKLFGSNYAWVIVPEHQCYFSKRSLNEILKKAGFKKIVIFSPPRALLNFSVSFGNLLTQKKYNTLTKRLLVFISIPVSIITGLVTAKLGRGEVLRFVAYK